MDSYRDVERVYLLMGADTVEYQTQEDAQHLRAYIDGNGYLNLKIVDTKEGKMIGLVTLKGDFLVEWTVREVGDE